MYQVIIFYSADSLLKPEYFQYELYFSPCTLHPSSARVVQSKHKCIAAHVKGGDDVMDRLLIDSDRLQPCDQFINITFHWHSTEAVREKRRKKTGIHPFWHHKFCLHSPVVSKGNRPAKPKQTAMNVTFAIVFQICFFHVSALFFSCCSPWSAQWLCYGTELISSERRLKRPKLWLWVSLTAVKRLCFIITPLIVSQTSFNFSLSSLFVLFQTDTNTDNYFETQRQQKKGFVRRHVLSLSIV